MTHDTDSTDTAETDTGPAVEPIRSSWQEHDSPSIAIIETVAAVTGRELTDLPPLYESIDTDALDALVSGPTSGGKSARVSFAYAGADVAVESDGGIEVRIRGTERERFDADPRTDSELNELLQRLLVAASRNGVPVRGGWTVRNDPTLPDWDVHITRVTKP